MAQFPWTQSPDPDDKMAVKRFFDDVLKVMRLHQTYASDRLYIVGTGTPEGNVTARVGSLFLRTDSSSTLYVKQTGDNTNTGWVLK